MARCTISSVCLAKAHVSLNALEVLQSRSRLGDCWPSLHICLPHLSALNAFHHTFRRVPMIKEKCVPYSFGLPDTCPNLDTAEALQTWLPLRIRLMPNATSSQYRSLSLPFTNSTFRERRSSINVTNASCLVFFHALTRLTAHASEMLGTRSRAKFRERHPHSHIAYI